MVATHKPPQIPVPRGLADAIMAATKRVGSTGDEMLMMMMPPHVAVGKIEVCVSAYCLDAFAGAVMKVMNSYCCRSSSSCST